MPRCQGLWDEQDINLYNRMPFWIAANNAKRMAIWSVWDKLTGSLNWSPNDGTVVRGVRPEPTPIGRQIPNPNAYTAQPKKDVMIVREVMEQETLYRHNFESPLIHWLPSFADWRRDQVGYAVNDISDQVSTFNDQWTRAHIFYKSPYVYVSGRNVPGDPAGEGELVLAPNVLNTSDAFTDPNTKNLNWLAQIINEIPPLTAGRGNLGLLQINKVATIMREDIQAPFFEGAANMPTDGKGLAGRYCLVGGFEYFSQLIADPYLQIWKPLDLNTSNDGFTGNLFGFVTAKFERFPLRLLVGPAGAVTIPAPQTLQLNPNAYNLGETIPNPDYINAQIEVAFLVAAMPYRTIRVGPPPKEFASGKMSESKFNKLQWNGEVRVTDNVLRQCLDQNGATVLDTNKYGEFLQLIADVLMGELPVNRRFVLPIIYRRSRVQTN